MTTTPSPEQTRFTPSSQSPPPVCLLIAALGSAPAFANLAEKIFPGKTEDAAEAEPAESSDDDGLDDLREQISAMQKKLDKLGR